VITRPSIRPQGDERWIYVARRHWIALLARAAGPLLLGMAVGALLLWRVERREPDILGREPPLLDPVNGLLIVVGFAMLLALIYIYVDWKNDHLIVSNKRLIHEDRTLLLAFNVETIPIERIQNVNIRIDNVLQRLLKYGRVEIQAAGPTAPIIFTRVEQPSRIQSEVMKEVNREKRDQEQRRLRAAIQHRIDPSSPPPPPPFAPIAQDLRVSHSWLSRYLPLGPVVEGNTVIWRHHWLTLARRLLVPILGLLLWLGALLVLPGLEVLGPAATTVLLIVALLVIGGAFWWQYSDWHNDLYILEPTRIIELSRLPFGLFENRREAPLGVIQNVNAESPNLFARLFGYGNVLVETAGQAGDFTFDHVPDPGRVQRIVFEYVERFRWHDREREWNNALTIVEMYQQTRGGGTKSP
jgi:membrane protein YdbS with pleckstrin-like domain